MTRTCFLLMVRSVFGLDYLVYSKVTCGWTTTPWRPCLAPVPGARVLTVPLVLPPSMSSVQLRLLLVGELGDV